MTTPSIKARLKAELDQTKRDLANGKNAAFNLGSSDVSAFSRGTKEERIDRTGEVSSVPVASEALKDPVMKAAETGAHDTLKTRIEEATKTVPQTTDMTQSMADNDLVVEITPAEKNAFLEALVTGDRYQQPFTLFAGRITGLLENRTQSESSAIIAQLNRKVRDGRITNVMEYSGRLRSMLLAAQVRMLKDNAYEQLARPLMATVKSPTEVVAPAWLPQVDIWAEMGDAITTAIFD